MMKPLELARLGAPVLSWAFIHDCFVFLVHAALRRGHVVVLDDNFAPPMPRCQTCDREERPRA